MLVWIQISDPENLPYLPEIHRCISDQVISTRSPVIIYTIISAILQAWSPHRSRYRSMITYPGQDRNSILFILHSADELGKNITIERVHFLIPVPHRDDLRGGAFFICTDGIFYHLSDPVFPSKLMLWNPAGHSILREPQSSLRYHIPFSRFAQDCR